MIELSVPDSARAATRPAVVVALFGAPRLTLDNHPIQLPRRQLRALLYRLAAELHPVPRERLCFLLWPDVPDSVARRHLTVLLNQLRQAFPVPDALVAEQDAVRLDPALVSVDTVVLAQAMRAASTNHSIQELNAALELYRGPFLHGFTLGTGSEFDVWADHERRSWERRFLDALALLVDHYAAQGAYGPAIGAAERALAVDELAEEMHRRLIELYAASGDRSGALRQFERCVEVLERELGVSPLPETRAMYEAVRDGHISRRSPDFIAPVGMDGTPDGGRVPDVPASRRTLPAATTLLLGRDVELLRLRSLLLDPGVRLVTLCGPGGSGKTRLAQQISWDLAEDFVDGVVWVTLATVRNPALVIQTIAGACELKQSSISGLAEGLREKQMLLVLDNVEHLLDAGPDVAALLAAAPRLCILATSRSALQLRGEHTFAVLPLPLPDLAALPPLPDLAAVPSVALLLMRSQALNPRFVLTAANAADVAAICVRLDGLPLAIELAAARLKVLPPRDLLRRLDRRLAVLTNGPRDLPDRQQTLHATIDWSYRLLDFNEQIWFERCSVFAGSWTLGAAEGLEARLRWPGQSPPTALDALHVLIDKSLVQVVAGSDGDVRYTMLETIREFAADQLRERGAREVVAAAHADFFAALCASWSSQAPQWRTLIEGELDNLRAALRWYLDESDDVDRLLHLGTELAGFWYTRSDHVEARWWMERMLERSRATRNSARARLLYQAALFNGTLGDLPRALALHEEHLALCRELELRDQQCLSHAALGILLCRQGDLARSIQELEDGLAVARELGDQRLVASMLDALASVLTAEGRHLARALEMRQESLSIARVRNRPLVASQALAGVGLVYAIMGDYHRAEAALDQAISEQREMKATMHLVWSLQWRAGTAWLQRDYAVASVYFQESLAFALPAGGINGVPGSLDSVAEIAAVRGQPERGARLLGAAEALRETLGIIVQPGEQPIHARAVAAVLAVLAPDTFHAAWQAGRGLSAEQAIAEAQGVLTWRAPSAGRSPVDNL